MDKLYTLTENAARDSNEKLTIHSDTPPLNFGGFARQEIVKAMKLLVRNLARETTEVEIRTMFEAYGAVQSCNLVTDKESGHSKGFAFVEMPKSGEAKAATKNLNGTEVTGARIRVKKAKAKADTRKSDPSKSDA